MPLKGQIGPELVSREPSFIWGQGWSLSEVWRGRKQEIESFAFVLKSQGYEIDIEPAHPYALLIARKHAVSDLDDQDYVDRFRFQKDSLDRDGYSQEAAQSEAATLTAGAYKKNIEDAVGEDDPSAALQLTMPIGSFPAAHKLLLETLRGADSFEDEVVSMSRTRIISTQYAGQLSLEAADYIYTTADLVTVFNIPPFAHVGLPADGVTITDARWGWLVRKKEVSFIGGIKKEFVWEWVFAAWSTNLYTPF